MLYRGTTPTIRLHINNAESYDLNTLQNCEIAIVNDSGRNLKTFTDVQIDDENKKIFVRLSHEDTLSFEPGYLLVQFTATLNGDELASPILRTEMGDNLKFRFTKGQHYD